MGSAVSSAQHSKVAQAWEPDAALPKLLYSYRYRISTALKFMQYLSDPLYKKVEKIAKARGLTVQELLRQAIGDWLERREVVKRETQQ